ncbi:hypothetical protein MKleb_5891 (plasmid) [Klebsiella sp. PL-2018]|nr:hypothetical protein MKleb_5891 [Klebsiella sp. PL-2018]
MAFRSKKNRKRYSVNIRVTTTRRQCAAGDDIHGQEFFETMIQSPNHQGAGCRLQWFA